MGRSLMPSRRQLLDLVICVIVLMAAYAARGWILASWLQGAYPFSNMIVDVLALGGLILVFRAIDGGVAVGLSKLIGTETRQRRILAGVLRFSLVFTIAAPFLVTLSQLHPQRIVPVL